MCFDMNTTEAVLYPLLPAHGIKGHRMPFCPLLLMLTLIEVLYPKTFFKHNNICGVLVSFFLISLRTALGRKLRTVIHSFHWKEGITEWLL